MISFVFTMDQIRSAPRPVREWLTGVVQRELVEGRREQNPPSQVIAKCSADEAAAVLQRLRDDYLACQVFFELGRADIAEKARPSELHRVSIQNIMHHVRLSDVQHLGSCFEKISEAFRIVRGDPEAVLLAFDGLGGCYVDRVTQQSILALWETLVAPRLRDFPKEPDQAIAPEPAYEPSTAAPAAPAADDSIATGAPL